MKEIVREFQIKRMRCTNNLILCRFPGPVKYTTFDSFGIKQSSKLVEIGTALPSKNVSALKEKALNIKNLHYRAFPAEKSNLFVSRIEGNDIFIYEMNLTYIFQPYYDYYRFDYTPPKLKKAESREEYERRLRSINYRLKNVDLEEFRTLGFENSKFTPRGVSEFYKERDLLNKKPSIDHKKLEETIKRARIVNMCDLVGIFGSENAVKSTLFKMTDSLCGRFVIKNSFYEKSLQEIRSKLLRMFSEDNVLSIASVKFLESEMWVLEEIADLKNGFYHLKGFKENVEFDDASMKLANLSLIKDLLKESRVLTIDQISRKLSIDEDVVSRLISVNSDFFHLSNNSYTLNDHDFELNEMFRILVDKKSFDLSDLFEKLRQNGITRDESGLIEEIKKYCIQRAGKFYLKQSKD